MEFMSRGRDSAPAPAGPTQPGGRRKGGENRTVRIEFFILSVCCALILLLVAAFAIFGNFNGESGQVNTSKYQAVFLNGGATSGSVAYTTYFGHITKLNSNYMILKDVYYLTTDSTSSSSNPQLTKLGCQQLHSPYDEMVINRNQVAFWENLQDNGKVVTAIKQFVQQNPNGPNCSQTSNSTSSNSNAQNSNSSTSNNSSSSNKSSTSGQ